MTGVVIAAVVAGLAAGALHAGAGPDHLAVVAPLAARESPAGAWRVGFRWGVGHALGVAMVGACALFMRELLPLEALESWSERLVGGSLIVVGGWVLVDALRGRDGHAGAGSRKGGRAALAVGTLHGTAGGSHLVGVLPALAFSSFFTAGAYVAAFAAGTVGAMTGFSWLVGSGEARLSRMAPRVRAGFVGAFAAASIVVGVAWLAP